MKTPTLNKWYVIYTKSRFEKKIYANLIKTGFQAFLPLIKEKRIWSDRLKTVEVPMFPSYVFVKALKINLSNIYYLPGFVRFVSSEGSPCEIKESDILLMDTIIKHGFPVEVNDNYNIGDPVRIIRGPLKGWEGSIENKLGNSRITFCFNCINQGISVEVPLGNIERVRERRSQ